MTSPKTPKDTRNTPKGVSAVKDQADWERIELDYRAGVLSLREIASMHGITHGAINKRAKRDDWTRDLNAKIRAKAESLVSKALVSKEVSRESMVTERQIIDAGAQRIAQVKKEHRHDIQRSRAVIASLLDELELTCGPDNAALLADLGEIMRSEDDNGQDKRNDLYNKLLSMSGRVKTMKDLGDSLKTMIGLEREAYSLDDPKAAAEQGQGAASSMTDAERAVRLSRFINGNPAALAALGAIRSKSGAT